MTKDLNRNSDLERFETDFENFVDLDDYLPISNWYYFEEDMELEADYSFYLKSYDDFLDWPKGTTLLKGWNFLSLHEFMLGKSLPDFKGTCNVERMYAFDGRNQQWLNLDFIIDGQDDFDGGRDDLGLGLVIKVSNECNFDFEGDSEISPPPAIPN